MHTASEPSDLAKAILGASQSVDLMCSAQSGWTLPLDLASIAGLSDNRLQLRFLVRSVEAGAAQADQGVLLRQVADAWQVRVSAPDAPTANCLILDSHLAFLTPAKRGAAVLSATSESVRVAQLSGRFERLWQAASDVEQEHFSYEDDRDLVAYQPDLLAKANARDVWGGVIRALAQDPKGLYELSPRKFEELISELLRRDGYSTELTKISRDGGRDVLATLESPLGKQLFLVECKKYSPDRPVGVSLVRDLYGVLMHERATAAMMVTTSRFTPDALAFREPITYQLGLKDYQGLAIWLRSVLEP